jgi:hypothetical protein
MNLIDLSKLHIFNNTKIITVIGKVQQIVIINFYKNNLLFIPLTQWTGM